MTKVAVLQKTGEIVFTPGGIKPAQTYQVTNGSIEVDDADLAALLQNLEGATIANAPTKASLAADKAAAEQAAHDEAAALVAAADNARAVAEASAAGAARAAAELKTKK